MWRTARSYPRQMFNLSSSFDHRIVDGWDAATFVQRIKALLETPALLLFIDHDSDRRSWRTDLRRHSRRQPRAMHDWAPPMDQPTGWDTPIGEDLAEFYNQAGELGSRHGR